MSKVGRTALKRYSATSASGSLWRSKSSRSVAISGPWTIYLAPWACGRDGGLATGRFEEAGEAMAEADRIVAAHAEDDGGG